MSVFWSGFQYEFSEPRTDPFRKFRLDGVFTKEIKRLLVDSRNGELRTHLEKAVRFRPLKKENRGSLNLSDLLRTASDVIQAGTIVLKMRQN
jgi:hypothetical protein